MAATGLHRLVNRWSLLGALVGATLMPGAVSAAEKLVVGHQMLAMPRYGGHTSVTQMREEARQWKDMGLDAVMLFDIGGTDAGGQQLAANGLKYHEAGVAEGFKFAMTMTYFPAGEIQRYADYVKNLSDPKYAAARLFVDGRPYLSAYHASKNLPPTAALLESQGYPVYLEPMVFPRNFFGDYMTQAWESGYITSATPETWNILYSHPEWQSARGFAAFEIAKSIPDQLNQIDWLWNTAKSKGKTARGSIVAYYKGFAHKGNWMCYEGWGFNRMQQTLKRAIQSGIPAIEFITLNDFTESSYFNSWAENDPAIIVNHWNTFDLPAILDHSGFRYFAKRYIQWFKTGQEPAITEDELYYSYRLHPRDASDYHTLPDATKATLQKWIASGQPAEWLYRKGGLPSSYSGWGPNYKGGIDWGKFSDGIHVAVRLKSAADVYINGVKVGDNLPAGEHLLVKPGERYDGDSGLGYPLYTFGASDFGFPRFEIRRNGQTILNHTGELEITANSVPGCWNVFARKAPAPASEPSDTVTVSLTQPTNGLSADVGSTVSLAASTTGSVSRVEFHAGATKIAEDTTSPWTASWTPTASGSYAITARAFDSSGTRYDSSSSTITITTTTPPVSSTRAPYNDQRQTVPGRIELENFDEGGQGVAYNDETSANYGGAYRSEGVDIETNTDGHHLAFFSAGEWMLYSLSVDEAARYSVSVRVACSGAGGTFRLELDGADISGTLTVPNTLGWSKWQTLSFEADLNAGEHDLKVVGLSNATGSSFIGNIDWIDFAAVVEAQPEPPVPTITSPADDSVIQSGVDAVINVSLSGDTSSVTKLEFFADGALLGSRTTSPWSYTWSEPPAGDHELTARVTLSTGATATSNAVAINVLAPAQVTRSPYGGTRATIPGRVEAENYDEGGADVAYGDLTATNILAAYRSDGVDVEAHAEGFNVGWFQAGEWMLYSVNASKTATYLVTVRVAANGPGGVFRLELDGVDISGSIQIPDTGGWSNWQTLAFEADISAGDHDLKLVGLSNTGGHAWLTVGNVDWIQFSEKSVAPSTPTPSLVSPASGALYELGAPVTLAASLAGDVNGLARLEFYAGTQKLGERIGSPWSVTWTSADAGTHSLKAVAVGIDGTSITSATRSITVRAPAPTPRILSPVSGSTFRAGTTIAFNVGLETTPTESVTIEVFANDALVGSVTGTSLTTTWQPAESGDHSIRARATTAAGAIAWSAVTDISIDEPITPPEPSAGSVINVRDFGAAGDGATDDTAAIRAALEAIGPLGGTVYFPAGVYQIAPQAVGGDALKIAYSDIAMQGDGPEKSVLSFHTLGGGDPATNWETINGAVHRGRAIVVEGSTDSLAPRSNISISSLRITGNAPATGNLGTPASPSTGDGRDSTHVAISFVSGTQVSDVRLENLEIDDFRGGMIEAVDSRFGLLEIVNCRIHGSNGNGIAVAADLRLIDNEIYDHAHACVVGTHKNRTDGHAQHGYYLHNTIEPRRTLEVNGLYGLVLRGEGDSSFTAGLRSDGLVLAVQNNTIANSLHHGLLVDDELHGAVIEGNSFADNGTDGNTRHGHLTLAPGRLAGGSVSVEDVVVRNNDFIAIAAPESGHAIFLDSTTGPLHGIDVAGNTVINAEADGGPVGRFLLLESVTGSAASNLHFTGNAADAIEVAVEDLSVAPATAMRPRYAGNHLYVTGQTPGQDSFVTTGATTSIRPSWSIATVSTDRGDAVVTLSPYIGYYPEFSELTLIAASSGMGFNLLPDPTWIRLDAALNIAPGESVVLTKRAGSFEVRTSSAAAAAPIAPTGTTPKTPITITLVAPTDWLEVPAGQEIGLEAEVAGDLNSLARVEFLIDGARIATSTHAPYTFSWMPGRFGSFVAQARAIGTNGVLATSQNVIFRVSPPPAAATESDELEHGDIGSPVAPGASEFNSAEGTYVIRAAGNSLDSVRDQFRFDQQKLSGDSEIVVRVAQFVASDASAQAGLMVRTSSHSAAAYAAVLVSPSQGATFRYRAVHGGETVVVNTAPLSAPLWIKLRREGSLLIGYASWNGALWSEIGRATVALPFIIEAGLATTSARSEETAIATYDSLKLTELPENYIGEDIGFPATPGLSVSDSESTSHVVVGAGSDIWGRRDQFQFAHRGVAGDATIMSRVESFDAPHNGAKAGVMIRASTAGDAPHVLIAVTPENGVILQWRTITGGTTSFVTKPGLRPPVSLALERSGGGVHAYISEEGGGWQLAGHVDIDLPESVEMGMAVTSRSPSVTATARFVDTGVVY